MMKPFVPSADNARQYARWRHLRYDETEKVWEALHDQKHVIVQTAPAVRVGLGEEFGMPRGSKVTGKMVSALKMLGFDKVLIRISLLI